MSTTARFHAPMTLSSVRDPAALAWLWWARTSAVWDWAERRWAAGSGQAGDVHHGAFSRTYDTLVCPQSCGACVVVVGTDECGVGLGGAALGRRIGTGGRCPPRRVFTHL